MGKVLFVCNCREWFDKVNGNSYFSCLVTDTKTGKEFVMPFQYGYGSHYQDMTLKQLLKRNLLPKKYNEKNAYLYERENNYPILWDKTDSLKRDMYKQS